MSRADRGWMVAGGAGLMIVGLAAALAVAVAVALFAPFEPYGVNDHDIVPTTACAGERIEVRIDYEIRPGYHVRSIEIESIWHPLEGPAEGPENGGTGTIYDPQLLGQGRHRVYSPIIRTAPDTPGLWGLQNVADVAATRDPLGLPNFQRHEYRSDQPLAVLPENDPRCADGAAGSERS